MKKDTQEKVPDFPKHGRDSLSDEERLKILGTWNDTGIDFSQDICLHELFEEQVKRTPDSIAIVFDEQQLTYGELNQRVNQLAHYLRKQNVGPEVWVGVCMDRSLEMVITLYAILKAGGAYVPLEPEYPKDRLSYIMEDIPSHFLICTQQRLLSNIPDVTTICVDSDWPVISQERSDNPDRHVSPNNVAYTIFTSGSTGKPKGVVVEHKAVVNRILWGQKKYQLSNDDVTCQKTPYSFDVSVPEFFWALSVGAKLIVAAPGGHRDSNYLADLVQRHKITTIHFVPSMLQIFLGESGLERCKSLKRVFCSGEELKYAHKEEFFSIFPNVELHNLYGPTEAAVEVSFFECVQGDELGFVPIGRPVSNTQLYILDKELKPVLIGDSGELHIGGVQLARGYLNLPAQTKDRFVPDPFSDQPEARLYKTGDLTRFLSDGNIEFLGRLDNQVKVRGFRIELGEIETVISKIEYVANCAVVIREDSPGNKQIVAYIQTRAFADRFETRIPVNHQSCIIRDKEGYEIQGEITNISLEGMGVHAVSETLSSGQVLTIEFNPDADGSPIIAFGEVVWTVGCKLGIHFNTGQPELKDCLRVRMRDLFDSESFVSDQRDGAFRLSMKVECLGNTARHKEFPCLTNDLSETGANLIGVPQDVQKGEEIKLLLDLGGEGEVKITAKVVWRTKERIGIEFAEITTGRDILSSHLRKVALDQGFTISGIRSIISEKLPDYMIPSHFVVIDKFPLTTSGKIDRKALISIGIHPSSLVLGDSYVPPEGLIQSQLADIWQNVLKIDRVGVRHSFYDLGGDSLLLFAMLSRMRTVFSIDLSIRDIEKLPTIEKLANHIKNHLEQGIPTRKEFVKMGFLSPSEASSLQKRFRNCWNEIEDIYPLTENMDNWLQACDLTHSSKEGPDNSEIIADGLSYHTEAIGCKIRGDLDLSILKKSWEFLGERHPSLRTSICVDNDLERPVLVVWREGELSFEYIDYSDTQQRLLGPSLTVKATQPLLGTKNRSMVKLVVVCESKDHFHCILVYNHLLVDNFSSDLMFSELFQCYQAFLHQKKPSLPFPITFRDILSFESDKEESSSLFWKQYLSGDFFHSPPEWLATKATLSNDYIFTSASPTLRQEYEDYLISFRKRWNESIKSIVAKNPRHKISKDIANYRCAMFTVSNKLLEQLDQRASRLSVPLVSILFSGWALVFSRYYLGSALPLAIVHHGRLPSMPGSDVYVGNTPFLFISRVNLSDRSKKLSSWVKDINTEIRSTVNQLGMGKKHIAELERIIKASSATLQIPILNYFGNTLTGLTPSFQNQESGSNKLNIEQPMFESSIMSYMKRGNNWMSLKISNSSGQLHGFLSFDACKDDILIRWVEDFLGYLEIIGNNPTYTIEETLLQLSSQQKNRYQDLVLVPFEMPILT